MAQRKVRAHARSMKRNGVAGMDYITSLAGTGEPAARRVKDAIENKNDARNFHIPENQIAHYRKLHKDGDPFPNPHREGWYHFIIEALKALGLDQRHDWPLFFGKVQELMSHPSTKDANEQTFWDRSLDPDSLDDREGRLLENVEVLQRLKGMTPYGLRIHQIAQRVLGRRGGCIDLEVWGDKLVIRLNLQPETIQVPTSGGQTIRVPVPINETRRLDVKPTTRF